METKSTVISCDKCYLKEPHSHRLRTRLSESLFKETIVKWDQNDGELQGVVFWGVGRAYAKGQSVQRSDCVSGTEMEREGCRDTGELAAGLVMPGLAGVWV